VDPKWHYGDEEPNKPPRMRWRTWEKLCAEVERWEMWIWEWWLRGWQRGFVAAAHEGQGERLLQFAPTPDKRGA